MDYKKIQSLFAPELVGAPLVDGGINLLVSPLHWVVGYIPSYQKKKKGYGFLFL